MARGFADTVTTALGAGCKTLERCALLNINGLDFEFINVGTIIVFSIGDGRLEYFFNNTGCFFFA